MKFFLVFLLVSPLFVAFGQDRPDGLSVSYDKFQNTTLVTTQSSKAINLDGAKALYFNAFYKFEGKTATAVSEDGISLSFISDSQDTPSKDLELRFLIDGKTSGPYFTHKENSHTTESGVLQVYFVSDRDTTVIMEKIAQAKKVEGQIGRIEFELPAEMIHQIKSLYEGMPKSVDGLNFEYDDRDKQTTVSIKDFLTPRLTGAKFFGMAVSYTFSGKVQTSITEQKVKLVFIDETNNTPELKSVLKLWIDGKPETPFRTEHLGDNQTDSGKVEVYELVGDSSSLIEKLAKATSVKGKLGKIEFELPPRTIIQIRTLYQRMHQK